MFHSILQKIRPLARSIKYGRLLRRAQSDAKTTQVPELNPPVSFIFGCGRSGTTILGQLLSAHDEVLYLFEPYHIWRAVVPATDMIQLYGAYDSGTHCLMGDEFITDVEVQKFNACVQGDLKRSGNPQLSVIEKTPINAMRISMLNAISPHSPMLHLVRDGIDVVRSIERLSSTNSYQLSGKGDWNQWWGRNHCKWKSLSADATAKGLFQDEIHLLRTDVQMGALEWLASLIEVNAYKEQLGGKLLEVCYNNLTKKPKEELSTICTHFGINPKDSWLEYCCEQLDSARKNQGDDVALPPQMCKAFNEYQEQYGFEGRAVLA